MRRNLYGWFLMMLLGLFAAGCANTFEKPPRWTVTLSALDYVEFLAGADAEGVSSGGPVSQYMLLGTGFLHRRTGASPRVSNEFWSERTDARWDSYETDAITVPATYVQACFQHLVDLDFFDDRGYVSPTPEVATEGVVVSATINGRRQIRFTQDPRIRAMVAEIARQF